MSHYHNNNSDKITESVITTGDCLCHMLSRGNDVIVTDRANILIFTTGKRSFQLVAAAAEQLTQGSNQDQTRFITLQ